MTYRVDAEKHRDHIFDQLGARQLPSGFQIWLRLRSARGEMVLLTTEVNEGEVVPSVADLWPGAHWCEREAAEGFNIAFNVATPNLLLSNEQRGYLRKEVKLKAREQYWPGSFDPAGKTMKPLGAE